MEGVEASQQPVVAVDGLGKAEPRVGNDVVHAVLSQSVDFAGHLFKNGSRHVAIIVREALHGGRRAP